MQHNAASTYFYRSSCSDNQSINQSNKTYNAPCVATNQSPKWKWQWKPTHSILTIILTIHWLIATANGQLDTVHDCTGGQEIKMSRSILWDACNITVFSKSITSGHVTCGLHLSAKFTNLKWLIYYIFRYIRRLSQQYERTEQVRESISVLVWARFQTTSANLTHWRPTSIIFGALSPLLTNAVVQDLTRQHDDRLQRRSGIDGRIDEQLDDGLVSRSLQQPTRSGYSRHHRSVWSGSRRAVSDQSPIVATLLVAFRLLSYSPYSLSVLIHWCSWKTCVEVQENHSLNGSLLKLSPVMYESKWPRPRPRPRPRPWTTWPRQLDELELTMSK